jgi:transketolase, putative
VIGAGVTIYEALKAGHTLEKQHNVRIRILDPFTIKPLDVKGIKLNALECYGKVLVVEDHYPEGGIGECVSSALSNVLNMRIESLAVREIPRSGPPSDLIEKYGIGAKSIIAAVLSLIN